MVSLQLANRQVQFWALQLFGWCGYALFVEMKAMFWEGDGPLQMIYAAVAALSGFICSLFLRQWFQKTWALPPLSRALLALLGVGVATGVWSWLKMEMYFYQYPPEKHLALIEEFIAWFTYSFFIILSWACLYFGIKYYQALIDEKEKTLKATSLAHVAQLKMLRYQLNPHFLFNTLNAISTLILEKETQTANAMVSHLSKFLRYSLDNDPMQKICLSQEVDALKLYLGIEQLRFEERLKVEFDITEDAQTALIPSLLLQPLIENAIKYAIATQEGGGTIRLAGKIFADELLLELSDDGPGIQCELDELPQGGVGLNNTRSRMLQAYGDNHSFQLSETPGGGLKICLRIPAEFG
jgi:signal transduction histidine kinase